MKQYIIVVSENQANLYMASEPAVTAKHGSL